MSYYLFLKKCWIGMILASCIFFGGVYIGLDYSNQKVMESKVPENENGEEKMDVKEAALQTEAAIEENKIERLTTKYPCKVQMKQEIIGLFGENEQCIKEYKVVGEYFSKREQEELQRGIWIQNEQELIMVLESFHLQ